MTTPPLRVVVLSSTQFGYQCIAQGILPLAEVQLAGILTTPRQIEISYSPTPIDIKTHATFDDLAKQAGCEVVTMTGKMNSENYLQYLQKWNADFAIALGWYYMIPRKVREFLPVAGIHASLLPKYRGGAPLNWAIIQGEEEAGVSFFYFEDGVDDGDLIAQGRFPILPEDTIATVYEKANQASIQILRDYLPQLANGTASRIPQDASQATHFPQRKPEDGLIDWSWDAKRIKDFIRAQTKPYPGAFTYIDGKKVIIWDADISET